MMNVNLKCMLYSDLPKYSECSDILMCVDNFEVYVGHGSSKPVSLIGVSRPTPSSKYYYEKINSWLFRRIEKK